MRLMGVGLRVQRLAQHRFAMAIALLGLAALSALGSRAIAADPPPDMVEVVEERSANSRTFKRSDGSMTTHLYAGPIHFREGGRWKTIDTALKPAAAAEQGQGYGMRMKSNGFNVLVKRNLDDRYLRIDVRGEPLQLGLRGAREGAPANPSGNRVTFGDVLPGVDLRYAMAPEGVKEELLLNDQNAPSAYTFVLEPPEDTDLVADELPTGDWVFRLRRGGRPFFVLEAPFATDAPHGRERAGGATRRQDRDRRDHVAMDVTKRDGQFEIALRVDPEWLRDDVRRFPVTVDPTLILQPSTQTAEFDASCGVCEGWDWGSVWIGPDDYGSPYRSAFQFDLSSIPPSASVSSAKLGLYNQADYCVWTTKPCGADAHTLNVHRMTKPWTSDVTTWSQVGWDTVVAASTTLPQGAGDQWMTWDVTSTAASWISGATPNYGVLVKRATEPTDAGGPEVPGSSWDGDPLQRPKLEITYTSDAVRLHEPETLRGNGAELQWDRWDGSTGNAFGGYEVHRSATASFTPSAATLVARIADVGVTSYRDTTAAPRGTFTYKIVTNGKSSVARTVTLPADGEARKVLQPTPERGLATYIDDSAGPSTCSNYGAEPWMYVGNDTYRERALLGFDLRDIPSTATVTSATLSAYMSEPPYAAITVGAHRVTAGWDEGTATWGDCSGDGASWVERSGGVSWATRGGDYVATATATKAHTASDVPGWDSFDVTSIARSWVSGTAPNHGILLRATNEAPAIDQAAYLAYNSDDYLAQPTLRPKLAVSYTDPAAKVAAPEAQVSSPAPQDRVAGTTTVAAAVSDDRRVEKVEFLVDGAVKATDTAAPYSYAWDTKTAANGTRNVTVRATDDAGNTKTTPATAVTVANSAPPTTRVTTPSQRYDDVVVQGDSPALLWRLADAATATTAADASGNGRAGTYAGSRTAAQTGLLTNDTNTSVALLNATADGRVSAGLAGLLPSQITAEAWVSYAALITNSTENRVWSRNWGAAGGWRLSVARNAAGQQVAEFAINNAGTVVTSAAVVTPGKLHLAGTYDGATLRLYVNGRQAATASTASAALNTTASVFLGDLLTSNTTFDEAALYGRALTPQQLLAHYEAGTAQAITVKGQHTVQAVAGDDGVVNKVEFYVDGNRVAEDATSPYSATLDTKAAADPVYDGAHVLTTKAYDDHGQVTTSANANIAVRNTDGTPYVATFTSTDAPQAVAWDPGATTQDKHGLDVTVTNRSTGTWSDTDYVVRPRWISPDGAVASAGADVVLGSPLAASASRVVRVLVEPPALPDGVDKAQYRLQVDVFQKSTSTLFADRGNKPLENPVIVNKALLTGLGLEKYYHYDGEELGAGMQQLTNIANGNSLLRWTPFESPGRGLSTVLDLTYNSLEKKSESPVGNNFSLAISGLARFGNPIDIHPNKADEIAGRANRFVELTDGDGTTHRFVGRQAADGTVYWEEPAGVHLYLRSLPETDVRGRWAFTRPDRVTFFFDADGYPTMIEDGNGNRMTYTLEATPPGEDPGGPKKRVTAVTDAAGQGISPAANRSYRITYYSKADAKKAHIRGKIKRITDHDGSALDFVYYEDGNLLRIVQKGGTNADGSPLADRSFVFTYTTSNGDAPAIPAAADRVNPDPKTPNQSTRVFSVADPRGKETTFTYLGPGYGQDRWKLASRTDRAGQPTAFSYDIVARVTTVAAPLSRTWKYAYDVEGKLTRLTNPKNEETLVGWTGDRHVARVTNPRGKAQRFEYDANGYLTHEYDELDRHTELRYQYVQVDDRDVAGKWKAGRTHAHIGQLTAKITPRGKTWAFGYDERTNPPNRGNLTSVTDPESSVTQHDYNTDGTLKLTRDPRGSLRRFPAYDANGLTTQMVVDMDGLDGIGATDRLTQFGHNDDGLLLWVQDPEHRNATGDPDDYRSYFYYDAFHRMGRQSAPKSTTHELGQLIWTGAEFDANDNITRKIGAHQSAAWSPSLGSVATRTYDAMDRLTESTRPYKPGAAEADIERTKIDYDAAGRRQQVTSPKGVRTPTVATDFAVSYDYDPLDRVIRSTRSGDRGDGTSQTRTTHMCFDNVGDLRSVTAPRNGSATIACGTDGAPVGTSHTSRIEYTAAHEPSAKVDANGHRREMTYDLDGNLKTEKDQEGTVTTKEYNGRDQVTKTIAPLEGGTAPRNVETRIEYDPAGNVKKAISPRAVDSGTTTNYVTEFEYNAADEMVRRLLPKDGTTAQAYEHRAYDLNGRLVKSTLPVTQDTLAAAETAEPKSIKTQEYFDTGWIRSSKDENPRIHYDYTAEGWQRERVPSDRNDVRRPDRRSSTSYFPDGQVEVEYDRAGEPTTFKYDANNQLVEAIDKGVRDESQKALKVTATYNGFDEVATTVLSQEGKDDRHSQFSYDPNGNVDKRWDDREVNAAGTTTKEWRRHEFVFDPADRLDLHRDFGRKAEASDDREIDTDYLRTGWKSRRVISRQLDGVMTQTQTTDWTYFLNGQVKTLVTKARAKGSSTWSTKESHDVKYVKDGVYLNGHRYQDVFLRDTPKASPKCKDTTCTQTFTYDARDRLTAENNGAGTTRSYELDAAGNVVNDSGGPNGTITYDYSGGQMDWQQPAGGTKSYSHYDDWGNLDCVASSPDRTVCEGAQGTGRDRSVEQDYEYDPNDNLESFDDFVNSKSEDHIMDAFDRPVEDRSKQGTDSPKSKLYSYIGLSTTVSDEEEFNREKAGGAPSKTRSYTYGADGERVAMTYENKSGTAGPKEYGYGHDPQGSISLLLDDAATAQGSYGYSAYGEPDMAFTEENDPDTGGKVNPEKDALNPYRYTDKRWSPVSKQLDMGVRRFAPTAHSFIQDDRYEGALDDMQLGTDPLTQNRYALAGGNPVSFVEVDGHFFNPVNAIEDAGEAIGDAGEAVGDVAEDTADAVGGAASDAWEAGDDIANGAYEAGKFVVGDDPLEIGITVLSVAAAVPTGGASLAVGTALRTGGKAAIKGGVKLAAKKSAKEATELGAQRAAGRTMARAGGRGRSSCSINSFAGGTSVLMADGSTKAIRDIRIGDRVKATDPVSGRTTDRRVEDVIVGFGAKRLVKLTIGGRTMTATAGHPFWLESRGEWVDAEDVQPGDVLREADGDLVEVGRVHLYDAGDQTVYNLTVASTHTYHAGARLVLVHNAGCTPEPQQLSQRPPGAQAPQQTSTGASQQYRQQRLRETADDPKVSRADRGWIRNEMRHIRTGNRDRIRTPPGKDLAHWRGFENARGFSYRYSGLNDRLLNSRQQAIARRQGFN